MTLKVLTLNIWDLPFWFVKDRKKRIKNLPEYLKKSGADIICLQESFDVENRSFLKEQLSGSYMMAGDVIETRRILFIKLFDMTGGLVVFSKFPITSSRFVPYSRFLNSAISETLGRKGFLEVIVETPIGDVKIVNTHMHQETHFFSQKIRFKQTEKMVMKTNNYDKPIILAGDFNENYLMKEYEFAELFRTTGFSDPSKFKEGEPISPTYRPENTYVDNFLSRIHSPKRYDYILVKNLDKAGLKVTEYKPEYLTPPISDHDPLFLTLST